MKNYSKYGGIILAAGAGSRIKPLSLSYPKPMLPICNKPIIQYQIEAMVDVGITDIVIVCGQLREQFEKQFGDGYGVGASIRYVKQEKPLGIAHALAQVESCMKKPFLLFLGDIFFVPHRLERMIELFEARGASGILAVKNEPDPDRIKRNYAVLLHESGIVRRVVEKPRYITNNSKGCGLYFFDLPIFDAVRRTPRTAMRDEYEITSSIQILIEDGYPVYPAEVVEWDVNITFVDDLIACNLFMLDRMKKEYEIGREVTMHPDVKVIRSVIGHNVVIEQPVTITNSVIMNNSRVSATLPIRDALCIDDVAHVRGGVDVEAD